MENAARTTATSNNTSSRRNIYQEVTQLVIDKMKEGNLVWNQGFRRVSAQNWVTKSTYSGINYLILNYVYGHEPCPYYATFKQIKRLHGTIKKGAKGKMIVYYSPYYIQEGHKAINQEKYHQLSTAEQDKWERKASLQYFYLFNMCDTEHCDGFDYDYWANPDLSKGDTSDKNPSTEATLITKFKKVLDAYTDMPIIKDHRNTNAYAPSTDTIKIVPVQRWENKHDFVATVFHELVHSSGHTSRCNRPNLMDNLSFGSKGYAQEELVAELGAAFLCHHIDILPKAIENTAAYLQSWIEVLEKDERLLFRAAAQAQKAVHWILKTDNSTKKSSI